jgi:hypothetical protein
MALTIPTKCVSLEKTRQHHFEINLTSSRHGIADHNENKKHGFPPQ